MRIWPLERYGEGMCGFFFCFEDAEDERRNGSAQK